MKILVTGGAGFIGSHTVVELVLDGHEPVVFDSFVNSKPSVLARVEEITGYTIPLVHADVRDTTALDQVFKETQFDAVIHFAGLKAVGESVARPLDYFEVNVGGSVTLLQAMIRHEVDTLVFSSSATRTPSPLPRTPRSGRRPTHTAVPSSWSNRSSATWPWQTPGCASASCAISTRWERTRAD